MILPRTSPYSVFLSSVEHTDVDEAQPLEGRKHNRGTVQEDHPAEGRAEDSQIHLHQRHQLTEGDDRLVKLSDVLILNPDGDRYQPFSFSHAAHSAPDFLPRMTCTTCHHTHEDTSRPLGCTECHDIDGDAGEAKKKTNGTHKKHPFPLESPDQEYVSCLGCHKTQNALIKAGLAQGELSPASCSSCHKKRPK